MPRHYKANRARKRTPWETYNYWYDQKTRTEAGKRKYHERLTKSEFDYYYKLTKEAGYKNPAKTLAEKQRKIRYSVQREYEQAMGKRLSIEEYETKEAREELFFNFAEQFDNMDDAREAFEGLY